MVSGEDSDQPILRVEDLHDVETRARMSCTATYLSGKSHRT